MSASSQQLADRAEEQILELIELVCGASPEQLRLRCDGRGRPGDGSVAAMALFTADNYLRIASFVADLPPRTRPGRHVPPRFLGHAPEAGRRTEPHGQEGEPQFRARYNADTVDPNDLLARLATARRYLSRIADLSSADLVACPPAGTVRFADGTRTLAMVLSAQLKHQAHNVEAVRTAMARPD